VAINVTPAANVSVTIIDRSVFASCSGSKLAKESASCSSVADGGASGTRVTGKLLLTVKITSSVGAAAGQGTVDLTIGGQSYGGEFEEVALQNAKQELIGMFPYIRLMGWTTGGSSNIPSGFVAKFRVPHDIGSIDDPPMFRVLMYMTVFGESDIPYVDGGNSLYAGLKFSYSVLPDYTHVTDPGTWPSVTPPTPPHAWNSLDQVNLASGIITRTSPLELQVPFGSYELSSPTVPIYKAYDPVLIHNESSLPTYARRTARVLGEPFPAPGDFAPGAWTWGTVGIKPGSLVAIRVERANVPIAMALREYKGSVGFINMRWKLAGVEA